MRFLLTCTPVQNIQTKNRNDTRRMESKRELSGIRRYRHTMKWGFFNVLRPICNIFYNVCTVSHKTCTIKKETPKH